MDQSKLRDIKRHALKANENGRWAIFLGEATRAKVDETLLKYGSRVSPRDVLELVDRVEELERALRHWQKYVTMSSNGPFLQDVNDIASQYEQAIDSTRRALDCRGVR